MRLKSTTKFPDAAPPRFRRDLERFAEEVSQFAERVDSQFEGSLSSVTSHGDTQALWGQLCRVNPQGSSCIVYCPRATGQNIGQRFVVTVAGQGSVVIQPIGATIDDESAITITSRAKLVTVRWDGMQFVTDRPICCSELDYAVVVTSMAPTFPAYLTRDFAQALPTLTVLSIRQPNAAVVARQWVIQRYGSTLGLAIPSPGPSGIATAAHQVYYAVEVNRRVVATTALATGQAYATVSLVASLAATDMVAVYGITPSGGSFIPREYWTSSLLVYGP